MANYGPGVNKLIIDKLPAEGGDTIDSAMTKVKGQLGALYENLNRDVTALEVSNTTVLRKSDLSSSVTGTSTTKAATELAAKTAYDNSVEAKNAAATANTAAATAQNTANAANAAAKAAAAKAENAKAQSLTVKGVYTGSGGRVAPADVPVNTVQFNMMTEPLSGDNGYKDCLIMNCYTASDVQYKTMFAITKHNKIASQGPVRAWVCSSSKDDGDWSRNYAEVMTDRGINLSATKHLMTKLTWPVSISRAGTLAIYEASGGLLFGLHANGKFHFGKATGETTGTYFATLDSTGIHCNADSATRAATAGVADSSKTCSGNAATATRATSAASADTVPWRPKAAAGVGQWTRVNGTLPSGGTWAWWGGYGGDAGVSAGGTRINGVGFAWRIA